MEKLNLVAVPALIGAVWFGIAAATLVQLAQLGGTLEAAEAAQRAHQASVTAPRVALVTPQGPAR
jgi:hypothetical protein